MELVHFDCPLCDSRQQKPRPLDILREHMARVHLDNLSIFTCPRCHANFVEAHLANHHIKNECKVEEYIPISSHTRNILGMDTNYLMELQRLENEAIALRVADPPAPVTLDLDDIYMLAKGYGYKLVKDTGPQVEEARAIQPSTGSDQPASTTPPVGQKETASPPEIDQPTKRKCPEDKWKKPKQKCPPEIKEEEFAEEEEEAAPVNPLAISAALLLYETRVYCQPCQDYHPEDTKCPKLLNIVFVTMFTSSLPLMILFPIFNSFFSPGFYMFLTCIQPFVIAYVFRNLPETTAKSVYEIVHDLDEEVRSRSNTKRHSVHSLTKRHSIAPSERQHLISPRHSLTPSYNTVGHHPRLVTTSQNQIPTRLL